MDAFSDVLETLHLTGTLYCRTELRAPFGLRVPRRASAMFYAVRRGTCWLRPERARTAIPLTGGDFVMFPSGLSHTISDEPGREAENVDEVLAKRQGKDANPLRYGGKGAPVSLLCGHFQFEAGSVHPLLSLLPNFLHVPGNDGRASPLLDGTLELLAHESSQERAGSKLVIRRATYILFVQLIRTYLETSTEGSAGWLRGLGDPHIAKVLASIHQDPQREWTLETLSTAAGVSRSAFCARFAELVGEPPYRYLTRWRMQRASEMLRRDDLAVKAIAGLVGFKDEAAFSKAFKRYLGVAPATFRRQRAKLANEGNRP